MSAKLDHALRHAANGFAVFPLVENGKEPAIGDRNWRGYATTDAEQIRKWWNTNPDRNIALVPGPDTVVIDVDVRDGKEGDKSLRLLEMLNDDLPATWIVTTASGGQHRYFRTAIDSSHFPAKIAQHVDVKRFGGYLVAPGSTIDGREYVANDAPIAPAPAWIEQFAHERRDRPPQDTQTPLIEENDEAVRRATDYLQRLTETSGTYRIAARVKDFGVHEETALALMCEHWRDRLEIDKDDEHIAFRVRNAFRYGQMPPGVASAEAEFADLAVTISDTPPPAFRAPIALQVFNAGTRPKENQKPARVKGLLRDGMLCMITGQSNAGKSPVLRDLAFSMALGREFMGRKVRAGYVLGVVTEGFSGEQNRLEAVRRHLLRGEDKIPFEFTATPVDLRSSDRSARAIADVANAGAKVFGLEPALVFIDTLSHAMGGGDESNAADVRAVIANIKKIRDLTGASVMLAHHPPKDGSSHFRGSGMWLNDLDLLLWVEREERSDARIVSTPRTKDFAPIKPRRFRLPIETLGHDEDGDPITAVRAEWCDDAEAEFGRMLTPIQVTAVETLAQVCAENDEAEGRPSARFTEWFSALQTQMGKGKSEAARKREFQRIIQALLPLKEIAKTPAGEYFTPLPQAAGALGADRGTPLAPNKGHLGRSGAHP